MMEDYSPAEKQLISSLRWFRTRYAYFLGLDPDRPASKELLESFGKEWIGEYMQDWSPCYDALVARGILRVDNGAYSFTATGDEAKEIVEAQTPFFAYEYDNYFALQDKSAAHHAFCEKVYGKDLSQHGMIDMGELQHLSDALEGQSAGAVLDLGCGNGRLTEHLAPFYKGHLTGLDISPQAIISANRRTEGQDNLHFVEGNMNHLSYPDHSFDVIISLDTLYYSENRDKLMRKLLAMLKPGGKIFAYFSQWIMDVEEAGQYLAGDNTGLAITLKGLGVPFSYIDLTASGLAHWKLKHQTLQEMKGDFEAEGSMALWNYRNREAERYANWGDDKYARYFYTISKG